MTTVTSDESGDDDDDDNDGHDDDGDDDEEEDNEKDKKSETKRKSYNLRENKPRTQLYHVPVQGEMAEHCTAFRFSLAESDFVYS